MEKVRVACFVYCVASLPLGAIGSVIVALPGHIHSFYI